MAGYQGEGIECRVKIRVNATVDIFTAQSVRGA